MDIGVISVRYARALLKSATDQKLEDRVYQEMQRVAKCYIEVPMSGTYTGMLPSGESAPGRVQSYWLGG